MITRVSDGCFLTRPLWRVRRKTGVTLALGGRSAPFAAEVRDLRAFGRFRAFRGHGRGLAGSGTVRALDLLVDLGAVHRNRARRFDPQLHGVAIDRDDDDTDVVTDHDRLVELAAED